jgi:hypothetical protein
LPEAKAIQSLKYLDRDEIKKHLQNVEYIIMAASAPKQFPDTPIHFTIFLNTDENLPKDIQEQVLQKFLKDEGIGKPAELLSQVMPVGFSMSNQETYMPMLLVKREDMASIPHTPMFVMDFLADSENFMEAKIHALTGWTYSYN